MIRDSALIPSEAVRLAALGMLAEGPRRYAEVAAEVRHFVSRMTGPSLELIGSSLELLRHEGLVERADADADGPRAAAGPEALLRITAEGRREMESLLQAPLQGPINDVAKLVIALKLRFLHLLAPEERRAQIDLLAAICEAELLRLRELRARHAGSSGNLSDWIDHEMAQVEARARWFRELRGRL